MRWYQCHRRLDRMCHVMYQQKVCHSQGGSTLNFSDLLSDTGAYIVFKSYIDLRERKQVSVLAMTVGKEVPALG